MIVVAGEALIDVVVTADEVVATPGGAPYNVARGCARLGVPTALLAALSSDGFGRRLATGLADSGVSPALLQRTARPTTLAVAEIGSEGSATYRFYVEGTSAVALTATALPEAMTALVTGGLGLVLEPMATTIEHVVGSAPDAALLIVDVNCRPAAIPDRDAYVARLRRVLGRADVIKVSAEDLDWLHPAAPVDVVAARLLVGPTRAVLVTAGDDGTTVVTTGGSTTVPVAPVPVVDTIGAGDAFTAGFASWWLGGGRGRAELADRPTLERAVLAAHAVAAAVVGRRGADPPHRRDLPAGWS